MSTSNTLTTLIVCSDSRADELAIILAPTFEVYRRRFSTDTAEWSWSVHRDDRWNSINLKPGTLHPNPPAHFDALFFHTGQGDPSGIPPNITFRRQFSFSEPGATGASVPSGMKNVIPIQRPFDNKSCPVKNEHLGQLVEFITGKRSAVPDFCLLEKGQPATIALFILAQGYLAARKKKEHIKHLGFSKVPEFIQAIPPNAAEQVLRTKQWWRMPFGSASKQELLAAVASECRGKQHAETDKLNERIFQDADLTEANGELVLKAFVEMRDQILQQ